jgi:hypothetical protein
MLSWAPWLGQAMQFDQLKRREFITLLAARQRRWAQPPVAGNAGVGRNR